MNAQIKIFVDADAFIALAVEDDANHKRATGFLKALTSRPAVFVTSNYVFSECVTVISQQIGRESAIRFIDAMEASESPYVMTRVDSVTDRNAIGIFRVQTSKNTSFVDCANMAVMRNSAIPVIFSFDEVYRKNGFTMVEDFLRTEKRAV